MDKESYVWEKLIDEQVKSRVHRVGVCPPVFITFSEYEPQFYFNPFGKVVETTARRVPDEDDKTQKLLTSEEK